MAKVDFHYIKTGTGELSGPSFVEQTELAVNELGGLMEAVENTAGEALAAADKAQTAADNAQAAADTALSQAQEATGLADQAQQAADSAQATADEALSAAQGAQSTADGKAPIMHASAEDTYGAGTDALLGHVKLSDALTGTEQAAGGKTAATPYAVSRVNTTANNAQNAATQAGQAANTAQESANKAQQAADNAQNTADAVQTALSQAVENIDQQMTTLSNARFFQAQDAAVNAEDYAGSPAKLYLTAGASASAGLPAGVSFPLYFWSETTEDNNTTMMYVLSGNVLYSQMGMNTTPEAEEDTWKLSGWARISYGPATLSALGVVKPDGLTTSVSADGTISINRDLLGQVYKFRGSVAAKGDLPADAAQGDVYNVADTGVNYGWTGTEWDALGGIESVDAAPVQGSGHPVASGGVYTALEAVRELAGEAKETAEGAVANGLPPQEGNAGKFLKTDGSTAAWADSAVELSDAVDSDSGTTAASSKAVKTAYDKAVEAATDAGNAAAAAAAAQAAADGRVSKSGDTMTGNLAVPFLQVESAQHLKMKLQDARVVLGTAPAQEIDYQLWFTDKNNAGVGLLQHIAYPDGHTAVMMMTRTKDDGNWASVWVTQDVNRNIVAGTSGSKFQFGNGAQIWVE